MLHFLHSSMGHYSPISIVLIQSPMNNSVASGGICGAVVVIGIWIWEITTDIKVPPEVAAAITTVVSSLGAWISSKF